MCGINGFTWEDRELVRRMNLMLAYRGPDDSGIYTDSEVSLGHNRLSIIDLSRRGHQPMVWEGRWIAYNGEIYNFREIRSELEQRGHRFCSDTDTEVILHAFHEWGPDCAKRFNGMFAFALWDSNTKRLLLCRDRLGVKPLYYANTSQGLVFSSEIKAILLHGMDRKIDTAALDSFLSYRFIASDRTMISGISKLRPGHWLIYEKGKASMRRYWSLEWKHGRKPFQSYVKQVDSLLKDSVEKRLMSDVPLGVFLSGGLDSSLVTAINARLRSDTVKSFCVGFGHETDELRHAQRASELLGTEHKELVLGYSQLTKELPRIVWHMDEPHTDITMVPLYFLSRFARRDVTVVNTGEGADELFSGYYHYQVGAPLFRPVPEIIRRSVYSYYYSPFKQAERASLLGRPAPEHTLNDALKGPGDMLSRLLRFDIEHELPNWQLTRVDRMSMSHAMEARVPFLDYRMVELAARIPSRFKQSGFAGKHVLKKAAQAYLPSEIINRRKQGFTTPMHAWLKHGLEQYAEDVLLGKELPMFKQRFVESLLEKHKRSSRPMPFVRTSYQVLILTLFRLWHSMYVEQDPAGLLKAKPAG